MVSQRQLFLNHLGQTSPNACALEIERAEGIYMYTPDGKKITDLISGVSVSNLGHCHPKVVSAVKKQAETYMHLMVYGELLQSPQVQLATKIANLLPNPLSSVYLVNSGSEAVEGALKLAKRVTKRTKIISTINAYHGSTHGALSVLGSDEYKTNYGPLLPNVHFVEYNNIDQLSVIDEETACIILEPIQSESGIIVGTDEYLQAVRKKCDETGALLIFDEVQNGFGRTGKMFAFEHSNVIPDIITFAKGIGGGMPIGAFAASKPHMDCLTYNPMLGHITTFGGHPVSSAAALACVTELEESNLIEESVSKAELFKELLLPHPKISSIRGKGLFFAIEFCDKNLLAKFMEKSIENGFLADQFLFCDTHFRIAPPLIITEDEIRTVCAQILKAIDEL